MKARRQFWPLAAVGTAVAMLALSFAAVPLYSLFCKVTGYAGTTGRAVAAPGRVVDQAVEVRFDANTARGLPLEFAADQAFRTVKLGETALVFFRVRNVGDTPIHAVATYNVTPFKIATYFQKLECFCFEPRVFAPGETLELPIVFFVDPRMIEDRDTKEVTQITLSYTYYEQPQNGAPLETAALRAGRDVATR